MTSILDQITNPKIEIDSEYDNKMVCFICLSKKKQLIQPGCLCKTTYVHPRCYKKWAEMTKSDFLKCGVCKSAVSINFVKKCVTLEQLMIYPNKVQEQDYKIGFIRCISIPGIANYIPIRNGELFFRTQAEKTRVQEANKRLYNSERYSIPIYKKPYRF
jgi:hypothetical protein